ncbi:MAG: choice-of-anchor Q domain-containing protein [Anaerolineales bacterium]|nr:choice-of-anchor Q domain-containing protein [Anaerolineales bacterium]
MNHLMKKSLSLCLAFLLAWTGAFTHPSQSVHATGNIIYVDKDASGAFDGTSWTDAYKKLQNALAAASSGDQIWVAEGAYYPDAGQNHINNDRTETFQLINGVAIYGGFAGTETLLSQRDPAANLTILSGDIDKDDTDTNGNGIIEPADGDAIAGSNAYHVVTGGGTNNTAILDGFVITAGHANGASPDSNGGGMSNNSSSPTLASLTFIGNTATNAGGMYNVSSSPTLTNVTFSDNFGSFYGGGMYNSSFSSPTLTNVTFSGNSAGIGGGMSNNVSSSPALTNVTFNANSATYGGGMSNNVNSSPTLTDVTFSGNTATLGGGMYNSSSNPALTNVTFSANSATVGGGMYNSSSSPTLKNTLIANSASGGDCVNNASTLNAASSNNLIEDSLNACGLTNGANGDIIGQDPALGALVNNGGFTQTHALLAGSPAIDAGTNAGCSAIDQRGVTRPQGSLCDIGAYEGDFTPPTVTMSSAALNPTNASPISVTAQFSETVTGFIAGDIIPGNGAVGNFTAVDGDTYTFDLTPSGQGPVTADIAAGVASDSAGNVNTAATQFSRTYSVTYNLFLPLILR